MVMAVQILCVKKGILKETFAVDFGWFTVPKLPNFPVSSAHKFVFIQNFCGKNFNNFEVLNS